MGAALEIRTDLARPAHLRASARRGRSPRTATRMLAIASALEGKIRAEAARLAGIGRQVVGEAGEIYGAPPGLGPSATALPGRERGAGPADPRRASPEHPVPTVRHLRSCPGGGVPGDRGKRGRREGSAAIQRGMRTDTVVSATAMRSGTVPAMAGGSPRSASTAARFWPCGRPWWWGRRPERRCACATRACAAGPMVGAASAAGVGNTMRNLDRLVRACASLALLAVLLRPVPGSADHDRIPDPAPRATAARLPADLGLDRNAVTVSGLS